MKNFVSMGTALALLAPAAGVVAGVGVKIGSIIAIAASTAAEAEEFTGHTEGVFDVAKVGAQAWAVGDLVYFDDVNARFTKTAGALQKAGYVVEAALAAAVVGRIKLCPTI